MGIFDNASEQKLPWQDEASQRAEERLKKEGILLPWHYSDSFGEDFKVLALRAGGMGVVFFVKFTRFGERIYAAKTLQRFLRYDYLGLPTYERERTAKDFLEEALPWHEMSQHPNIVTVHLLEYIVHPATKRNVPFVFLEFMERGDLRNLVIKKGRLSLEETLSVGLQICEGLLHAYKHGISAHKDLKPENIMIYKDGIYKVTDFSAGVIGTPGYMAREQVAVFSKIEKQPIDHHADQFAIGLIMHDVFKGGDSLNEQIKRVDYFRSDPEKFTKEGIKKILSFPDDMPGSLKEVIARCLSPDPIDRFPRLYSLKNGLLDIYRTEFGRDYRLPTDIDDSAEWWFNRGRTFYNIGRYADAEISFKEALKRIKRIPGTEHANCLMNIGIVCNSTGKLYDAEYNLKEALGMFKGIRETEMEQAKCLMNLGVLYNKIWEFSKARSALKDALEICERYPVGTEQIKNTCLLLLDQIP